MLRKVLASSIWIVRTAADSRQAQHPPEAPPSYLIGTLGVVTSDIAPRGTVLVEDLMWTANTEDDTVITAGERVNVAAVDGIILTVSRSEEQIK